MKNELVQYCKSLNSSLIENSSDLIDSYEVDIYFPEQKIAIEFNGLFDHSEFNGNKKCSYNINKTNLCKEKEIELIHVFENEWVNKPEIIKSIIKNKLKLNDEKIFARKCIIKDLTKKEAEEFFTNNHIQGYYNSRFQIGLFYKDELVSAILMGKSRYNKNYTWEITRFCSKLNTSVVGGFSKLIKHFRKNNEGSIITYADLRYGEGNVYTKNGFTFLQRSKPNYFYTKDFKTLRSRVMFQKHKLNSILDKFDPSISEWENMKLNNYDRIWDCGNNVYVLK